MGIPDLRKLLMQEAPSCIKTKTLDDYRGQKVAIDANIALFAFMATDLVNLKSKGPAGQNTGHIIGFLQRTAKFLSLEINPIYIFDGDTLKIKRPELLRRRAERYGGAKVVEFLLGKSSEAERRYKDCEILLKLMGVPCFKALDEGEALCCHLSKTNQVNAVASEDSDCLVYGAEKVLVSFKATTPKDVAEYDLKMMLEGLGLTKESFIDFCILAGCDYCDRIAGMNPEKALELVRQFETMDKVLKNIDRNIYEISEKWLAQYQEAKHQFTEPDVKNIADDELKTKDINDLELKQYLVMVHGFQEKTVEDSLDRIRIPKEGRKPPSSTKGSTQGGTKRRTQPDTQGSTQGSTKPRLITQFYKTSVEKEVQGKGSSKRSEP